MSYQAPEQPVLQLALDYLNTSQAEVLAAEAVPAGIPWVEVGTPLIKAAGLDAVRAIRKAHPQVTLVADMKVMDAGRVEVEAAAKAGADVVMCLGAASDATVQDCIAGGKQHGVGIGIDLVSVADPVARAKEVEALGADFVSVHTPIDQQMEGADGLETLKAVAAAVSIPVACAGGITAATAGAAVAAGARIVIAGGSIAKATDAKAAAAELLAVVGGAEAPATATGARVTADGIRDALAAASTPNLSDAMHRGGAVHGITNMNPGKKLVGPAVTVTAFPGDWSCPVQAIDRCPEGAVLVVDAAGVGPALWGGLATQTAIARKLGGVVIHGACRDIAEITGSELPLFAVSHMPNAGDARGVGAYDLPVTVCDQKVQPGDWLVGDEDGLVVVPAAEAVVVANRAADINEREARFAKEIESGQTLAEIAQLGAWERADK